MTLPGLPFGEESIRRRPRRKVTPQVCWVMIGCCGRVKEVKARGGAVSGVVTKADRDAQQCVDHVLEVPPM